jgi:NAD(P)-dependent dehydrogenase (short-subunit alcohol dehydrogenase family)
MTLNVDLTGQVALVTGASSGLGEHFAQVLSGCGAKVAIVARRVDRLQALQAKIANAGGYAFAVEMDVSSEDSVESALTAIQQELGNVSILVNNAGMAESRSFLKMDEQNWRKTMDVNLDGAWRVAHRVSQQMVASGTAGCIVNIASILGLRQGFGHTAYAVSKAGVVQMTKSMALELGRKGVRVNALCPGYIETEINADYFATDAGITYVQGTPAGRVGRIEELDGPLLLLCSEAGSFVNGVALPVDGGHLVGGL